MKTYHYYFFLFFIFLACEPVPETHPVDISATKETVHLYINLEKLAEDSIMFGHQDDLAYGVGWQYEEGRSDVLETAGSLPAVFGWDIGAIGLGDDKNLDGIPFEKMRSFMIDVFEKGGMNTVSWHTYNPVTKKDSWADTEKPNPTVSQIIPGGEHHDKYEEMLDRAAAFFQALKTVEGKYVPVVFRPFHENNGNWFWWGAKHSTPQDYKRLFQFTVDYFRNEKNIHHVLYAYSPDRQFETEQEYLERYPGDRYVDIIGTDNYWDFTPNGEGIEAVSQKLEIISTIAEKKSKVAAFTESGLEAIPDSTWWTGRLYPAMTNPDYHIDIAWVLVWRNFSTEHHYAPYPGHPSEEDFRKFKEKEEILFLDEMNDLYK
jgi:mannan endo-1,4-beta-mannosidase